MPKNTLIGRPLSRNRFLLALESLEARDVPAFAVVTADVFSTSGTLRLVADFNNPVSAATLQPGDLLVDGAAAASVSLLDADTAQFVLPALGAGSHTLAIAGGAISDTTGTGVSSFSRSVAVATAAQYTVNQNPRLQLGDAPLAGFGFANSTTDRVDILWQTIPAAGAGTQDSFAVAYRPAGGTAWQAAPLGTDIVTGVENRVVRSASITGLNWNSDYEYRVRQFQGDVIVNQYQTTFHTRLQAGDATPFTFAAYGDSADPSIPNGFRQVQGQINQSDAAFSVLLGDNIYNAGTHQEADQRFSPTANPEAAAWIAGHIDYLGLGNHDVNQGASTGIVSEQSFSVPIPVAGVTSPVSTPASERPEHSFSFDYGDVHFVTFDTNSLGNEGQNTPSARLNALLDWVVADLNASTARWKIVYGHHPVSGVSDKVELPEDSYYQQVVSRLKAAGADLFMTGHSHSYEWTYPLTGQVTSGTTSGATFAGTYVNHGSNDSFISGEGLVQLVSGAAKELRNLDFSQYPFVAGGFDSNSAVPGRLGFAKVSVTHDRLTVDYVAANDGAVIDSFTITKDSGVQTATFQEGADGYAGTVDTYLQQNTGSTNNNNSAATSLNVIAGTTTANQALLRFDNIFGSAAGQIPAGATIRSATLQLQVSDAGSNMNLHRMLTAWSDTSTWNSLTGGVTANGTEATAAADTSTGGVNLNLLSVNVLSSLQAWLANPASNLGWVLIPTMAPSGTDNVTFASANNATIAFRPKLIVTYVMNANLTPTAANDTANTTPGTPVTISVLGNDGDPDGDPLTVTVLAQPAHGTAAVNADNTVTYTPAAGWLGADTFTYTASDGRGGTAGATVTVTTAQTVSFQQGVNGYTGTVDTFLQQNPTFASTNNSAATSLSVDNDDTSALGYDTQVLLRFDNIFGTGSGQIPTSATITSATLQLNVTNSGDVMNLHRMLSAWADTATWNSLTDGVQADGAEAVAAPDVSSASFVTGTLSIDVSASLRAWLADPSKNRGWVLLPTGSDGVNFDSAEGTTKPKLIVTYEINSAVNLPPFAADDAVTTFTGTPVTIAVLANDSDPNSDPLTVTVPAQPAHGTAAVNADKTVTYTPAAGWLGADSFTYMINDGRGGTASATVSVTTTTAQTATFQQGVNGYAGTVDTFLQQNAPTANNSAAAALSVDTDEPQTTHLDTQALLRFDNIFGSAAGQIPTSATITSATLQLQVTDGGNVVNLHRMFSAWAGTSTWNSLTGGVQNDGAEAVAAPDVSTAAFASGVLSIDVLASLRAWKVNPASNLGWAFLPTGSDGVIFTSAEGATVSLRPKLVVTYDLNTPNQPPTPSNDATITAPGTAVTVAVLINDRDPNDDPLTVTVPVQPAHGTAVVNADKTVTYTPVAGWLGADTFGYTVSDGRGGTASATVTVTTAQTATFQQGVSGYTGTVDTFLQESAQTTNNATIASLKVDNDDPSNSTFDDQILLRFDNIFGTGAGQIPTGATITSATLQLNVTNGGDIANLHRMLSAWADTDTWSSLTGGVQTGTEAVTAPDASIAFSAFGVLTLNVTSSLQAWLADPTTNRGWVFLPTGPDGVNFDSAEGPTASLRPKLTVNYVAPNQPPVAVNDTVTTTLDTPVTVAVLANDSDPNSDPLTVQVTTPPAHGTAVVNADNTVTYTPAAGWLGADTFTYTASDARGGTASATVTVTTSAIQTVSFQQNVNGYTGTVDTYVRQASQSATNATTASLNVDSDETQPNGADTQTLLRFDNIFGSGVGQIPANATILSATLQLNVTNTGDVMNLHRMFSAWADTATWSSLTNGVQNDGVEAVAAPDVVTPSFASSLSLDVLASLRAWKINPALNRGWVLLPTGTDGVNIDSAEGTTATLRPKLIVTYELNTPNQPPTAANDAVATAPATPVTFPVLANDSDPNDDPLTVTVPTQPAHGTAVVNGDGTITYTPAAGWLGADPFTYTVSDGRGGTSSATVTVSTVQTVSFQQNVNGYTSAVDTYLRQNFSTTSNSTAQTLTAVTNTANSTNQALLRFDNIFGSAAGQIPAGATITSATLTLQIPNTSGAAGDVVNLYRMLSNWTGTSTWSSLTNGIQTDGTEAVTAPDTSIPYYSALSNAVTLDVTASLQAWLAAPSTNLGWAFLSAGIDNVIFNSSDNTTAATRPKLTVNYVPSAPPTISDIADQSTNEDAATAPIAFAVGDSQTAPGALTVTATSSNTALVPNANLSLGGTGANRTLTATPAANQSGTTTVTVTVSDGVNTTSDTFVLTVNAVNDRPTFTVANPAVTVLEDAPGVQSVANFAAFSAGAADESGQTATYTVSNVSNPGLFSVQPQVQPNGTLTYTLAPNASGTTTFQLTVTDNGGTANGGADTSTTQTGFAIAVTAVNDAPSFTASNPPTVLEDAGAQTVNGFATFSAGGGETGQTATYTVTGVSNPALFSAAPSVSPTGVLTYTPAANAYGTSTFQVTVQDSGGTANGGVDTSTTQTFTITVTGVADTVSVTNASTTQSTQTTSGLVVTRNAADGAEVTFVKVTAITNGTLFKNDGSTPITSGTFITYAEANAGLKFTPAAGFSGTGSFQVQGSTSNVDAGLGGTPVTASIAVAANLLTPTVTPATTLEDAQSTTGLVVTRNAGDNGTTTNYKITGITNGTLFKSDGTTPVANGTFITLAEGTAGLRFKPATNFAGTGTFQVQASTSAVDAGLGGTPVTASVTVTPVNDQPSFTASATPAASNEDAGAVALSGFATFSAGGGETGQTAAYTVSGVSNPSLFSVAPSVDASGALTYQAAPNASGTSTFQLTVKDSGGTLNGGVDTSATQTITITVNAVNDAPSFTAANPATVLEDAGPQTVTNFAAFNAGAPDESAQSVLSYTVSNVSNPGLFSSAPQVAANGTLTYQAAPNASGTSTFQLTVKDNGGTLNGGVDTSTTQTFTITVTAVNDAPSFTAGTPATVLEDAGPQTVSGFATFSAGGGEIGQTATYTVTGVSNPSLFSVAPSVDASGALTYTPAPNASGTSTFQLTVKDSGGTLNGGVDTSATQTITITVNAVNDAPSFTAGTPATVLEDAGPQTVSGFATFSAGGGETGQTAAYTVSGVSNPSLFSVAPSVDASGALTYQAAPNASGTSTFQLTVKDSGGTLNGGVDTSATQTITITVNAVNDAPSFTAGTPATVLEDAGPQTVSGFATFSAGGGETGQTAAYTVSGVSNPSLFSVAPSVDASGALTYQAAPNASGTSTFQLTVKDSGGTLNGGVDTSTTQTITITVNAVNDAPSFTVTNPPAVNEDSGAQTVANVASGFNAGAPDESGQSVLSYNVSGVSNAALFSSAPQVAANGTLTYTPAPNASGTATFQLTVTDSGGTLNGGVATSTAQTVTITVNAVNDAPSFTAGTPAASNEDAGAVALSGFATFSAGGGETGQTAAYTVSGVSNPSLFSVAPSVDASGALTYQAAPNASGTSTFQLTVKDSGGTLNGGVDTSATQTITITVNAVNDAPSFTAANPATVLEDAGAQTVSGFATFSAGGGETGQTATYTVSAVSNPSLFSVAPSVSPTGVLTYQAAPNASGSSTFSVTVKDSGGVANGGVDTSTTQTFTITVTPVNDQPSFTAGTPATVLEDAGPQSVTTFATFSAGGGETGQTATYTVTSVSNPSLFSAVPAVDANGTLTYQAAPNASGTSTFVLTVKDSGGTANGGVDTSATQTITITVTAVNDAPSFTKADPAAVLEDAAGVQSAQVVTGFSPGGGADEAGQTVVSYNVSNVSNAALFAVPPAVTATGLLTYTLNANASGTATFDLTVTDNGGALNGGANTSAAQTVTITVTPVNDQPSFTASNQVVSEDAGAQSVSGFATFSAGGGETGQTATYTVTGVSNPGLFSALPTVDASGVLTYQAAPNASGSSTFTLTVKDSGGTANGGVDTSTTQTFTITVTPVNDAPFVEIASGSITVAQDSGPFAQGGFATFGPGGGADEAGQAVTLTLTPDAAGAALFAAPPALDAAGRLTFTPAPGASGTATVTVSVQDNGPGTAPNQNVGDSKVFTITVSAASAPGPQQPDTPAGPNTPRAQVIVLGTGADPAGARPAVVQVLNATSGALVREFAPFPGYTGGIAVAAGDANGDGVTDIFAATATGFGHVKVFDGATGRELYSDTPFPGFLGEMRIAAGDVNGDGKADLVAVASGPGGNGHVKAFDVATRTPLFSQLAFAGFLGSVRVAAGDINGDGKADIAVVASGPGGNGHVKAFDGATGATVVSFFGYAGYAGEIDVAAGDVDGDGRADVLTTAHNPAQGTHVKAFSARSQDFVRSFYAPPPLGSVAPMPGVTQPARIGAGDVTGDKVADILLGSPPGYAPGRVAVVNGATGLPVGEPFAPMGDGFTLGIYVDLD